MSTSDDQPVSDCPLIDLDPTLADGLSPDAVAVLRDRVRIQPIVADPGPFALPEDPHITALLVVDGLLVRDVALGDALASQLLGPGDIIPVRCADEPLLPRSDRWAAVTLSRLAVIHDGPDGVLGQWPRLATRLLERLSAQTRRLMDHRAIIQMPRAEDRVLALLWHLAERWGRVGAAGVVVPVELTHEMIGRLVGARRPTVSLALKTLVAEGQVARRPQGGWLLSEASLPSIDPSRDRRRLSETLAGLTVMPEPELCPSPPVTALPADLAARLTEVSSSVQDQLARSQRVLSRTEIVRSELAARRVARTGGRAA